MERRKKGEGKAGEGKEGRESDLTENSHSSLGFRALLSLPVPSCSPITFSSTNKATNTVILARMVKAYLQRWVGDRRRL